MEMEREGMPKSISLNYMARTKNLSITSDRIQIGPVKTFVGHENSVDAISWLDAQSFVSGGHDQKIHTWNVRNEGPTGTLSEHVNGVYHVAVSPDGRMIASCGSGGEKNFLLWEAASGNMVRQLAGHADSVYHASFSPAGNVLISGGRDGFVRLHDVGASQPTAAVQLHNDAITCTAFCFDPSVPSESTLACVASRDGALSILDVRTERTGYMRVNAAHGGQHVNGVCFVDRFSVLSCGADFLIKRFDLRMLQQQQQQQRQQQQAQAIQTGASEAKATAPVLAAEPVAAMVYEGHSHPVKSLSISPDFGKFASCCSDGSIRVWLVDVTKDLESKLKGQLAKSTHWKEEMGKLAEEHDSGRDVDLDELKRLKEQIALSTEQEMKMKADLEEAREEGKRGKTLASLELTGHKDAVSGCSWASNKDGSSFLLSSSWDQKVMLWKIPAIE